MPLEVTNTVTPERLPTTSSVQQEERQSATCCGHTVKTGNLSKVRVAEAAMAVLATTVLAMGVFSYCWPSEAEKLEGKLLNYREAFIGTVCSIVAGVVKSTLIEKIKGWAVPFFWPGDDETCPGCEH